MDDDVDVYYSVEWLPKNAMFMCWNQYSLTRYRPLAYIYKFEARRKHGKNNHYRVRIV